EAVVPARVEAVTGWPSARLDRQREPQRGALARLAGCGDLAAVRRDELLRDREAEPAAARLARLVEAHEDVRQVRRRDARAGVRDRDRDLARLPAVNADSHVTRIVPPGGVRWSAFARMFASTCRMRTGSISTTPAGPPRVHGGTRIWSDVRCPGGDSVCRSDAPCLVLNGGKRIVGHDRIRHALDTRIRYETHTGVGE